MPDELTPMKDADLAFHIDEQHGLSHHGLMRLKARLDAAEQRAEGAEAKLAALPERLHRYVLDRLHTGSDITVKGIAEAAKEAEDEQ